MNLAFVSPLLLLLLPLALLPLRRRRTALPVPALAPFGASGSDWRLRLAKLHTPLMVLLLAGLIILLAGPRLRQMIQTEAHQGVDLMLAVDISASMGADDIPPQRIVAARQAAATFVSQRKHDRIGVILFSGLPYLLAPPTPDRERVAAALLQIEADSGGSGTALGDALTAAVARLQGSSAKSKAIILLTDGSSNRGRVTPLTAARQAAALGIRIYSIGFGTPAGGRFQLPGGMPMPVNHPVGGSRAKLAEKPLQELASLTGGHYFRAEDAASLQAVYRQIDRLEKSPLEIREEFEEIPLGDLLRTGLALLLTLELLLFRIWLRRAP